MITNGPAIIRVMPRALEQRFEGVQAMFWAGVGGHQSTSSPIPNWPKATEKNRVAVASSEGVMSEVSQPWLSQIDPF